MRVVGRDAVRGMKGGADGGGYWRGKGDAEKGMKRLVGA